MRAFAGAAVLLLLTCRAIPAQSVTADVYKAIRENDLGRLRALTATQAAVNARDDRGNTPLMHAASMGSVDSVAQLLKAGADVNAKNGVGTTALIYGAMEPAKVKLLVEAGADVNATAKTGRTPLIVAAVTPGSIESLRLLLAHGANVNAEDAKGNTPLAAAAQADNVEGVRLLLERKVAVNACDFAGLTALTWAAAHADLAAVELLLANGADPNAGCNKKLPVKNGIVAVGDVTPLMAAPNSSPEVIRRLLRAGAKANAQDVRGMTPLMLAVATEEPDPEIVRALLEGGADAKLKSNVSETAGDWLARFNHPGFDALRVGVAPAPAGAVKTAAARQIEPKQAAERAIPLLQSVSTEYFKQSGCVGCHHQPMIGLAVTVAAKNGLQVDQPANAGQLKVIRAELLRTREERMQGIFISAEQFNYSMLYMAEAGYPADAITDAVVTLLAAQQQADGSWNGPPWSRPPLEHSRWCRTAMAAAALGNFAIPARRAEFDRRIAAARRWMTQSTPTLPYERSFQVLGLHWTGASRDAVADAVSKLRKQQRPDGGWAQLDRLSSDAYATGLALYALRRGGVGADDPAYRKGVQYLLATQAADGSWFVASHSPKIQPYFQSGFPYDHDQWISVAGTAWAISALAEAVPRSRQTAAVDLRAR